jgi:hypothetical protein
MIVDNFDLEGIPVLPTEADPPAIIDAYAVLPRSIFFQRLKAIARRHGQIPQNTSAVQIKQLPPRRPLKSFESCYRHIAKKVLAFSVFEGLNHPFSILRIV